MSYIRELKDNEGSSGTHDLEEWVKNKLSCKAKLMFELKSKINNWKQSQLEYTYLHIVILLHSCKTFSILKKNKKCLWNMYAPLMTAYTIYKTGSICYWSDKVLSFNVTMTLIFDLEIPNSIGVITSLDQLQYQVWRSWSLKILVNAFSSYWSDKILSFNVTVTLIFNLETPNSIGVINRSWPTKFEDPWAMCSLVIDRTRFIYWPTNWHVQTNIPNFFEEGINIIQ